MTLLYTGFDLAERIHRATRARLAHLGRAPVCVTLYDGESAPAQAYVARQQRQAADLGIDLRPEPWPATEARARLTALAATPGIDAILPLLPLPADLSPAAAAQAIGAAREVDGQHPLHAGALLLGQDGARLPATAIAAFLCAREVLGALRGQEITLVGASALIGRPLSQLLVAAEATVTLCQKSTRDLARHCRAADLVITAAGVPGLLGRDEIAPGGRVLDLAICRQNGVLVGDADHAALLGYAALVSQVPDGVGPVTTACLLANITAAACGLAPDYGV